MRCYFITFRCYGTWLPGDERGAVNHSFDQPGTPRMEVQPALQRYTRARMNSSAVNLDASSRTCVEKTIHDVAAYRGWVLHALNVRTNHVHLVVSASHAPEKVMTDFKAWTTRRLREAKLLPDSTQIWADHGSTICLDNTTSFENACVYVVEGQGEVLTA